MHQYVTPMRAALCFPLIAYHSANPSLAQNGVTPNSSSISLPSSPPSNPSIPAEALQAIQVLDFKNTEIKDIVRGLATKYNLNVFVDDAIPQRITLRLANLSVHEALRFIAKEHGLNMTLDGNIYKSTLPEIPKPQPKSLAVAYEDGRLTVDVKDEEADKAGHHSGPNIRETRYQAPSTRASC